MTEVAILLLGLLAGALLQAFTGALGDRRAATHERAIWLRDKREAAFIEFMSAAQAGSLAAILAKGSEESLARLSDAIIAAQVYAPTQEAVTAISDIRTKLAALHQYPRGQRGDGHQEVRRAMETYDRIVRRELGITRGGESLD